MLKNSIDEQRVINLPFPKGMIRASLLCSDMKIIERQKFPEKLGIDFTFRDSLSSFQVPR